MFRFASIENIVWLLALPLVGLVFSYGWYQKRSDLNRFASPELLTYLTASVSVTKRRIKTVFLFVALLFLVLTLMRPQGNPVEKTVRKRGRDLVFVVDVSRSMLAEDLKPNRLARAKQLITDMLPVLEGDRIGLLVFAGATAIKCPLTLDYSYFLNVLDRIEPDDINRGGTLIGDAIRIVADRLFYDQDNKYRDVILITDGEDHESFPIEAATDAAQRGIKIHTVGLGDPEGSNIPLRDAGGGYSLLKHNNQVIQSRLDETNLKKIAAVTQGVFIPVRTNLVDLAELYRNYIAVAEQRETESKESKIWSELYQFFLGISMLALMVEVLISDRAWSIKTVA